ncbi:hypothetical protein [Alloactinosynnema sp. L-07]|uniref:hypothetical protein n=1 Tax=Alloactinosynnema sp. L-07 TaxID=1653480 RepID=UPI0006B54E88|nr:hypothetical protein [Alloactinosynnema sp. L-07]
MPPRLAESDANTTVGANYAETEHLSVPGLARLLMDELPEQFGLLFSATVYRYEIAAPWIIDVNVHGLPPADLESAESTNELIAYVTDWIDRYNLHRPCVSRFVGPNVIILREFERNTHTPGKVSVRRYHLRHPITRRLRRLGEKLNGLFARVVL